MSEPTPEYAADQPAATRPPWPGLCEHEEWSARVTVNRLRANEGGPVTRYTADITASCVACGVAMVFYGAPTGVLPDQPTTSRDGKELRAPCRPALPEN